MKAPLAGAGAVVAAAAAAWSLFEAQWVEPVEAEVAIDGLPDELDGFAILHLSDFHLGTLSLNARAVGKAVGWARARDPDLVAITGDLLSRKRGERTLRAVLGEVRARHGVYAVLGNHDVAETRDPFGEAADLSGVERAGAVLLAGDSRSLEVGGARVQVAGVEPRSFMRRVVRPGELADPDADLRILLCHFPDVVSHLPPQAFHLVLAGHLHGGQICLPLPSGKLRLEHLRAAYWEGLHETRAGMLHVSRGLGTSFVPFRFLARPDVAELTLRRAH